MQNFCPSPSIGGLAVDCATLARSALSSRAAVAIGIGHDPDRLVMKDNHWSL